MSNFSDEIKILFSNSRLNRVRYFSYVGLSFLGFVVLNFFAGLLSLISHIFYHSDLIFLIVGIFNIWWVIRRLHDMNFSGMWLLIPVALTAAVCYAGSFIWKDYYLLLLIPMIVITALACFIVMLFPGNPSANRFGDVS